MEIQFIITFRAKRFVLAIGPEVLEKIMVTAGTSQEGQSRRAGGVGRQFYRFCTLDTAPTKPLQYNLCVTFSAVRQNERRVSSEWGSCFGDWR